MAPTSRNFETLTKAVHEVCEGQPGKDILLIGGQADALPTDAVMFRNAHETAIVSVMPR